MSDRRATFCAAVAAPKAPPAPRGLWIGGTLAALVAWWAIYGQLKPVADRVTAAAGKVGGILRS